MTYIKGNKMRTDTRWATRRSTTIFDVDAQKMYIFESGKKEADVWDMAAFAQEVGDERRRVEHEGIGQAERTDEADRRQDRERDTTWR